MSDYLLLVYPLLWFILTFSGSKYSKKGTRSDEFLSVSQAGQIRAAACIGIIFHHLVQQITQYGAVYKGPVTLFNYIGYLFTALFFFFSGYGLIISLAAKPDYLSTFLQKRVPGILIPFWTVNGLWIAADCLIFHIHRSTAQILKGFFGIWLINGNGWFFVEIVLLYLLFYLFFRLVKNRDTALGLLCLSTCALIIFSSHQGHDIPGQQIHWFKGEWWYNSTFSFVIGLLYARFREKVNPLLDRYGRFLTVFFSVLTAAAMSASVYVVNHFGYYHESQAWSGRRDEIVTLAVQTACCLVFCVFILLLNRIITLGSKPMRMLSRISPELLLTHGFFITKVFGNMKMSAMTRFAVVLASSVLFAAFITPPVRFLAGRAAAWRFPGVPTFKVKKHPEKIKKIPGTLAAVFIAAACLTVTGQRVILRNEYISERKVLEKCSAGDEVFWGHFDTDPARPGRERLKWIVLNKDEQGIWLITKEGIAAGYYHQKHRAVTWEDSDLRAMLRSGTFLSIFSRQEIKDVAPSGGDLITLLSVPEALELFHSDKERELEASRAAVLKGINTNRMSKVHEWDMKGYRTSWWWLRGNENEAAVTAPIVSVDGEILTDEKNVNKPGGAIRPVIRIRLQ